MYKYLSVVIFAIIMSTTFTVVAYNVRHEDINISLKSPEGGIYAEIVLPNSSLVLSASMTIESDPQNPIKNPKIDIGGDGDIEWAFTGSYYGEFGEQKKFNTGDEVSLNFISSGYNAQTKVLLPKGAKITKASMDISPVNVNMSQKKDSWRGESLSSYGRSLACLDFDNDGYDDLIVGAPTSRTSQSDGSIALTGEVYLYFGSENGLSTTPLRIPGKKENALFGNSVASLGDINSDGYEDFAVGAPCEGSPYKNDVGAVYVFFGNSDRDVGPKHIMKVMGRDEGDLMGINISAAGDVDGDNMNEILVAYGNKTHGKFSVIDFDPTNKKLIVRKTITNSNPTFGKCVAYGGDLNMDNFDDAVVMAPYYTENYLLQGAIYIYYGSEEGLQQARMTSKTIQNSYTIFGYSAAGGMDISGDIYPDIVVGAIGDDGKGSVYVLEGGVDGVKDPKILCKGKYLREAFGASLSYIDDLDLDGCPDILIGAPGTKKNGIPHGTAYIYFSETKTLKSVYSDDEMVKMSHTGISVLGGLNIDNDIIPELVVSAINSSPMGGYDGKIDIFRYDISMPYNLGIIFGDVGDYDFIRNYGMKDDVKITGFEDKLTNYLESANASFTDSYGNDMIYVPINITTLNKCSIVLSNLSISYNLKQTLSEDTSRIVEEISSFVGEGYGKTRVPIKVFADSEGYMKITNIKVVCDAPPSLTTRDLIYVNVLEDSILSPALNLTEYFVDDFTPSYDMKYSAEVVRNSTYIHAKVERGCLVIDVLTGEENDNWTGEGEVRVRAIDGKGLNSSEYLTVNLHIINVNDPPVFMSEPLKECEVGKVYTYKVLVEDAEDDDINLTLVECPNNMKIVDKNITWMPSSDFANMNVSVKILASDGKNVSYQNFTIHVSMKGEGIKIKNEPAATAVVGSEYKYMPEVSSDSDVKIWSFTILKGSENAILDKNTGCLTWIPSEKELGRMMFLIQISDGAYRTLLEFNVTVLPLGTPISGITCSVAVPGDNEKVKGKFKIEGYSTIILGKIYYVELKIDDGKWKKVEGCEHWYYYLDSTKLKNGRHTIYARAFDGSNYSAESSIGIIVDNEEVSEIPYMQIAVAGIGVMVLCVGIIAGIYLSKRKKKVMPEQKKEFSVEDIFVVNLDGRLIHHSSRSLTSTVDEDILTGMLTAVQSFVNDALSKGAKEELDSLQYGGKKIILEKGKHIYIATVIEGDEPKGFRNEIRAVVNSIEAEYGAVLPTWDGDISIFSDCKRFMKTLLEYSTAEERVEEVKEEKLDVKLMSELEFYQGYIRLKVAIKNNSPSFIMDGALRVIYNEDALRLDKIEPKYPVKGREIIFGNIGVKEKKTVALYLDPQICMESYIDATFTFKDSRGKIHHIDMKRKRASVVCPIMYTDENINTAILKRLIEEELKHKDSKIFTLPKRISEDPEKAYQICKSAVQHHDIKFVREFIEREPIFIGEAWYYGKVKERGDKIVIKVSVRGDTKTAEFHVASGSKLVVTGLLAELKNDLNIEYKNLMPTQKEMMEQVVDEKLRSEIKSRINLLDKYKEEGD